jgi:hypothetical protein
MRFADLRTDRALLEQARTLGAALVDDGGPFGDWVDAFLADATVEA